MKQLPLLLVLFGSLGFAEFVFHLGALGGAGFTFFILVLYLAATQERPKDRRIIVPIYHLGDDEWEADAMAIGEIFETNPFDLPGKGLEFESQWRFHAFQISGDIGGSAPLTIKLQRIPSAFYDLEQGFLRPNRRKVLEVKSFRG